MLQSAARGSAIWQSRLISLLSRLHWFVPCSFERKMMMMMCIRTLVIAFVVSTLTLACHEVQAQVKPFKISGAGIAPSGLPLPGQLAREHWSVGNATHLGRYTGDGAVKTDSAFPQPNGTIIGQFGSGSPYVFTAANGDELVCFYGLTGEGATEPGAFELTILGVTPDGNLIVEARFIAQFVPKSELCTGKFAGVTGGWVMYAWTEPFVLGSSDPIAYWWEGNGALTFK